MRRIVAHEIKEVFCFQPGERPVFLLTFTNNEKLVVKAEIKTGNQHANHSIPLGASMMNQVSPQVEIEMLDDKEFRELGQLPHSPEIFRPLNNSEPTRAYLELYTSPEAVPINAYYKMKFVEKLQDISKGTPALMLLRLKKPPALFTFGKIVAIDLFIGNSDRFNAMGELVNEDNLLFQQIDGNITPVGLDFFQAQGEAANLLVGPPENRPMGGGKFNYVWGGENLLNENNMRFFAERAIQSLNNYFANQNLRRIRTLFGQDEILEFANGMREGVNELKRYLLTRGGLPEGVKIRMDKLNWPYDANAQAQPTNPAPFRFKTAKPRNM
jgi:hypothetical protein